jgi:hypothetical protein
MLAMIISNQKALTLLTKEAKKDLENALDNNLLLSSKIQYTDKAKLVFEIFTDYVDISNTTLIKQYNIDLDSFKLLVLEYIEGLK